MTQNVTNQNSNLAWSATGITLTGLTTITFLAAAIIPYALPIQMIVSYSLVGTAGGFTVLDILYIALRSRKAQKEKALEENVSSANPRESQTVTNAPSSEPILEEAGESEDGASSVCSDESCTTVIINEEKRPSLEEESEKFRESIDSVTSIISAPKTLRKEKIEAVVLKQVMKTKKKGIYFADLERAKNLAENKALERISLMRKSLNDHVNNNQAISSLSIGLANEVNTNGCLQAGLQILAHTSCFDYALVRPLEDRDQRRIQNLLWEMVQQMKQGRAPRADNFRFLNQEFEEQFGTFSANDKSSSLSLFFNVINQWSVNLKVVTCIPAKSFTAGEIFVVETNPLTVIFKRKSDFNEIQLIAIQNEKVEIMEVKESQLSQISFPQERTYVLKISTKVEEELVKLH